MLGSSRVRWTLVVTVLLIASVAALWPREHHRSAPSSPAAAAPSRASAGLADCPRHDAAPPSASVLRGVAVTCLADGRPVDLASALAGKPALINLWAYWCEPCAHELPALREYAARAGSSVTVLTAHSDPDEAKGLARLTGLGVRLPGVEDPRAAIAAAVGAPSALPVTVLIRADGSVAKVVARPFRDVEDIAETVDRELGVRS